MSETLSAEPTANRRGEVVIEPREPGTATILIKGVRSRRYLTWFTILTIATTAIWGGMSILLANHVQMLEFGNWFTGNDANLNLQELTALKQQIDDGTATATAEQVRQLAILAQFDAARAQSLSIIASVGVVLTMLVQPLVGVASDRTRSRWGRRTPWILFGTVVGAVLLVGLRFAPTVAMLAVIWMLAQAVINAGLGPLNATVADRMPENRRGTASALGGFGNFFGGVLGGVSAGALFAFLGLDMYFVFAAFLAFAGVMFVLFAREDSSRALEVPKFDWNTFFVGFTIALRSRNFRWVWVARILLTFGYAVSTALSLYMLQSYIRPALGVVEATQTSAMLALAGVPFLIVAVLIAGKLSDKLQKRRSFVIFSSFLMALSMLIPIISPTLPGLFLQAIVGGIAFGTYLPVDQALFIDVLPDEKAAGRDLGVAALGSNLGQALGPILAGTVVAVTGSYLGVWVAAFVLVILAAVVIFPLKGVK
ncbi:MFS family permease [Microbacterium terrae]|uniref:Transporter n=1 Tax=Microbacterium terrae TaxID=69369 RepID=A0A0M2HD25_9MICO|nr:MFS transporter [Microbacterium terrae]KJL44521.1 putative transporter [Microbacterium terrae]MBP1079476.1 MFS family permease [Microbacterium terrae]GLJ96817.1 MFS transporter [Microbacterium terrae]